MDKIYSFSIKYFCICVYLYSAANCKIHFKTQVFETLFWPLLIQFFVKSDAIRPQKNDKMIANNLHASDYVISFPHILGEPK